MKCESGACPQEAACAALVEDDRVSAYTTERAPKKAKHYCEGCALAIVSGAVPDLATS